MSNLSKSEPGAPNLEPPLVTGSPLLTEAKVAPVVPRDFLARLKTLFPPGQFIRYLMVGVFNTVFGYCAFALCNWVLFRHHVPASYVVAAFVANFFSITVAYLGYKWFAFRTRGNYLKEWLKALAVYTSSLLPALVLLPLIVHALTLFTHLGHRAPYVANAFLTIFGVIYNFFGHSKVTFRQPYDKLVPTPQEPPPQ